MENQLRIDKIVIENVNCFPSLELEFPTNYNVICGTNGIGKTTILNAIGAIFTDSWGAWAVRRRAASNTPGKVRLEVSSLSTKYTGEKDYKSAAPEFSEYNQSKIGELAVWLIYITPHRDFAYRALRSISRDAQPSLGETQKLAERGINHEETKNWFVNRYLFQHLPESRPPEHVENLKVAIACFSFIDDTIKFKEVKSSTFDIIVTSPNGDFPYEYLSSGYRSALSLLLGIIREIEFRVLGVSAKSFSGVIAIDEVDLHLHPTWQQSMPKALRSTFPKAQIIVSTHSPHIIQDAYTDQIIALRVDKEGRTVRNSIDPGLFGFKGWTVEEILEDVMGLEDPQTPLYREKLQRFDAAIDNEDAEQVIKFRDELYQMLHADNPIRKLISLQAAPFQEMEE